MDFEEKRTINALKDMAMYKELKPVDRIVAYVSFHHHKLAEWKKFIPGGLISFRSYS